MFLPAQQDLSVAHRKKPDFVKINVVKVNVDFGHARYCRMGSWKIITRNKTGCLRWFLVARTFRNSSPSFRGVMLP